MNYKKKVNTAHIVLMGMLLLLGLSFYQSNAVAGSKVDVAMKGKLLDFPPCEIYGDEGKGAPIRIGFDKVGIQRIDGVRFRKEWTLNVSCDETLGANVSLEMSYNGMPSSFDTQALVTSEKKGLAIRLYQVDTGQTVQLNTPFIIIMSSGGERQLSFYAVPVKDTKATLTAGKFTASATLALNYP